MYYSYLGPCYELSLLSNFHACCEIVMLLFHLQALDCSGKFSRIYRIMYLFLKTIDNIYL